MTAHSVDVGRCFRGHGVGLKRYKPLTQFVLVLLGHNAWCSVTETLVGTIPHHLFMWCLCLL